MNITNNIKRIRRGIDMTQEKLAEIIGVTPQAVSKWERGEGLPDITLVPSLASALGVTTDELFGMNEELAEQQIREIGNESARILFADMEDASDFAHLNEEGAIECLRAGLRDHPN
ncbi:MAG: helix-turn-helix domain-containing protein, partial [Oscillospiraceae bacterium]|nr:helix-turn-helix domain-containing protein [Oscillospiraceae bacterium]